MSDSISQLEIINEIKSKAIHDEVENHFANEFGLIIQNLPQNLLERWFELITDYIDVLSVIHRKELNPIIYHILNEEPPEGIYVRQGTDGHNNLLQLISKYDEWKSKRTS